MLPAALLHHFTQPLSLDPQAARAEVLIELQATQEQLSETAQRSAVMEAFVHELRAQVAGTESELQDVQAARPHCVRTVHIYCLSYPLTHAERGAARACGRGRGGCGS